MKEEPACAAKPKVLVIDDDQNLRKTLADILMAKGYEVRAAKDGAEGLAFFRKEPINMVLIDLRLPDMSGIDVLNRVKEESPSTQAIILTGSATLDSAIEATNKGAFSYLQKPYEIDQLMVNIRRAIEKQRAEEEIVRAGRELRKSNAELKTLYDISLAITRTPDMERLFPEVIVALAAMEIFRIERKGAIFLAEENGLRLAASPGLPDALRGTCGRIGIGECLCGIAARHGEIMISSGSASDSGHTISYEGMTPHGHIIVPLKAAAEVMGVLCLFTEAGAEIDDSILEPLRSVGSQLGVAIENARLYEKTRELSLHDPLTGLGNRRLLDIMLHKSFARAARFGNPLSVIMIDIDYFKKYNDAFGHVAGDKLLSEVSRIIGAKTREGDIAVRYGGEEFLVLLHQTDLRGSSSAAEALRASVERELPVTISLGVAAYSEKLKSGDDLVSEADNALYRAKQNGRNRVEVSDSV